MQCNIPLTIIYYQHEVSERVDITKLLCISSTVFYFRILSAVDTKIKNLLSVTFIKLLSQDLGKF